MKILVVGAGFAGAVYARSLADAGHRIDVIDRRDHIGGNAFDYIDERGVRVHKYGPHLFHTNNEDVVSWIRRFGIWCEYRHTVQALLPDGRLVPMPINRKTIERVFGVTLMSDTECKSFLARHAVHRSKCENAADFLYSSIGRELTDLFFRPYNKKMWGMELEEIDFSVVARVPLRYDLENLYFPNDRFQILPVDGYLAVFGNIFGHPNIKVYVDTEFEQSMESTYDHVFNSMPIDEYFDYVFGELPYRSIRFHHHAESEVPPDVPSVINFTDARPFTRMTRWHLLPNHGGSPCQATTRTLEEPCDYKDNNHERYYPVKASDNRFAALYDRYKMLASSVANTTFIGRCGTYQYLDMHQVINQSLLGAMRWLERHPA